MRLQRPDHFVRNGLGLAAGETALIVIGPMVAPVEWSVLSLIVGGVFGAWLALTINSMVARLDVDVSLSLTDPGRAFVILGDGGRLAGAVGQLDLTIRNDSEKTERVIATRVEVGRRHWRRWQHLMDLDPTDSSAWQVRQWGDRTAELYTGEIVDAQGISYAGMYNGALVSISEDESLFLRLSVDLWGRGIARDEVPVRASAKVEGR